MTKKEGRAERQTHPRLPKHNQVNHPQMGNEALNSVKKEKGTRRQDNKSG